MKQHPIYNVQYFIDKFEKIKTKKWTTGRYSSMFGLSHCALGHCGMGDKVDGFDTYPEVFHLAKIFANSKLNIISVNDGDCPRYQQPTPKQRILAALNDIKKIIDKENQVQPSREDLTKSLAVLPPSEVVDTINQKVNV